MNTMMSSSAHAGFALLGFAHALAALAVAIGIVLLIVWAIKTLRPEQMKTWGIWLVVGGFIVCTLTIGFYQGMDDGPFHMNVRGGMMNSGMRMMDHMDDDDDDDMMGMSMKGMTGMLEGKTGDAFDEAFIQGMIPHHQGAIDMAEAALKNAKHQEIKNMATAIISAQQKEIDQMKQWQAAWGYNE